MGAQVADPVRPRAPGQEDDSVAETDNEYLRPFLQPRVFARPGQERGGVQRDRCGGNARLAEGGRGSGDPVHLAVPQRPAGDGLAPLEQRELDAGRAAVEDKDQVVRAAHGGLLR